MQNITPDSLRPQSRDPEDSSQLSYDFFCWRAYRKRTALPALLYTSAESAAHFSCACTQYGAARATCLLAKFFRTRETYVARVFEKTHVKVSRITDFVWKSVAFKLDFLPQFSEFCIITRK